MVTQKDQNNSKEQMRLFAKANLGNLILLNRTYWIRHSRASHECKKIEMKATYAAVTGAPTFAYTLADSD